MHTQDLFPQGGPKDAGVLDGRVLANSSATQAQTNAFTSRGAAFILHVSWLGT